MFSVLYQDDSLDYRIGVQNAHILLLISGTDATHAEHIETIKNRCYVGVQQDGTFLPGQLGMGLVEGTRKRDTHLQAKPVFHP